MEKDVLAEVIGAEKEIQECLEKERKRYAEWIDEVRKKAGQEITKEEEALKASFGSAMEEAMRDARQKAALLIENSARKAEISAGIGDNALLKIVKKHISRILPDPGEKSMRDS